MISSWKSTASVISTTSKVLLNGTPNLFAQQSRTAVILKRKFPIRLYPKGKWPHKLNHRDYIYELVGRTELQKSEPLNIILTQFVEGVGEKGETVSMKPHRAYNEFLLPGLAVYASPENINKYSMVKKEEKTFSSKYAALVLKNLSQYCLIVRMSIENPWVIEKWHIRANFRKARIVVPDEAITLPEKEIRGPNLDNQGKEFYVTITINKTESIKVRCKLHHDTVDISKQLECENEFWKVPGTAIFPEDQEILDALPRPRFEEVSTKK